MINDRGPRMMLVALVTGMLVSASSLPDSPVADAAKRGDLEGVRSLIQAGADVNAAEGDGMTALHWAALNGDLAIAEVLIHAGARLDAATRNGGHTPLHVASRGGNGRLVQLLLDAGADPGKVTLTDVTPLHFAAASGSAGAVAALLAHDAYPNAKEAAAGQTPLIFAAASNRAGAIEVLLAAGADVAHATRAVDVMARHQEDMELFEWRQERMVVVWGDRMPTSRSAASDGDYGSRRFAEIMGRSGGMTALHHAVRGGNLEAALALLAGGADVNQLSADQSSPLLVATINGHWDLALQLLEHGADPTRASDAGATPLYGAINLQWAPATWTGRQPTAHKQQETSYLELMEALLEAGADPNARLTQPLWYTQFSGLNNLGISETGATPFWRAAYGTDVKAMRLLVRYGAEPDIPTTVARGLRHIDATEDEKKDRRDDPSGLPPVPIGGPAEYPIHVAAGMGGGGIHRHAPNGWLPAVKYLIEELGADVNARDRTGSTPLHHAAARGDKEMVLYLVAKRADVMAVNRSGQSPADRASRVCGETLQLLESLGAKAGPPPNEVRGTRNC